MNAAVWTPSNPEASNLWKYMRYVEKTYSQHFTSYHQLHQWSTQNAALFWQSLCDFFDIQFDCKANEILSPYQHMMDAQWFIGARFNFAEKLLSRDDDKPAIVSINEQGVRQVYSYHQLRELVSQCQAGLKQAGVVAGDRVAAIMPNVAHTVIAMLATTSLGAIWSSCSPDFGVNALVDRLSQIEPKIVFACDGQQYNGKTYLAQEKISQIANRVPAIEQIIMCPLIQTDVAYDKIPKARSLSSFLLPQSTLTFASLPFSHPVYILFSSGTTGKPKCIIHSAGGTLLQHIKELALHGDMGAEDNLCFYTTCGWMMWNWMVSFLALGGTLTLYEGSPTFPDPMRLFQLLEQEQVTVFGTSATFLSAIEKAGCIPKNQVSLAKLRSILSTGSPLMPYHYDFVYQQIKHDVRLNSISGGTDIISCFGLGNPLLPVYRGEIQCLGLGMSIEVYDDLGRPMQEKRGELVCTTPFPSMPLGFWNDATRERYTHAYFDKFPGVWAHGDFAEITPHGGLIIYGRSDAILNPGGVRIGTAEIYRQVETLPDIVDSVVIGQEWHDDVRVILFVKLAPGKQLTDNLKTVICQTIRQGASPRHVPAKIIQVADIPHTINGKLVELAVRETVHGRVVNNLDSLANPEALDYFKNREELLS